MQAAILKLISDVATGMAILHSHGITHGCLEPGYVMVDACTDTPLGFVGRVAGIGFSQLPFMLRLTNTHAQQLSGAPWGREGEG